MGDSTTLGVSPAKRAADIPLVIVRHDLREQQINTRCRNGLRGDLLEADFGGLLGSSTQIDPPSKTHLSYTHAVINDVSTDRKNRTQTVYQLQPRLARA